MSFIRASIRSIPAASARRYASTAAPKSNSKLPIALFTVAAASAGGYYYITNQPPPKPKQEKSPLDPQNFVDFKLKKVVPHNHNSSSFVFELPNNEASLIPVASCLLVKASDPEALKDAKGNPVVRPYTPVSASDHPGELVLLVKKYEKGNMSKYIHELKEGDTLGIKGPITKFPYKTNEFEDIALIGGGSGITPLYQILTHALSDPRNTTKFTLIYSNVTPADILLKSEFDTLAAKFPKTLNVVYLVDKPTGAGDSSKGEWTGPTGYITKEVIKQYVAPADRKEKVKVFVCGPPPQVASIAGNKAGMKQGELGGVLKELGYTEDQVFKF